MYQRLFSVLIAGALAIAAAGCATRATSIDAQWVNPEFAGKRSVRSVMVMAAVRDYDQPPHLRGPHGRRTGSGGRQGGPVVPVPAESGPVTEEQLRRAVANAGVNHAMVTRVINVTTEVNVSPGMVMGPAWGPGSGLGRWLGAGLGRHGRLLQHDVGHIDPAAGDDDAEGPCRYSRLRCKVRRGGLVGCDDDRNWMGLRSADDRSVRPAHRFHDDQGCGDLAVPVRCRGGIEAERRKPHAVRPSARCYAEIGPSSRRTAMVAGAGHCVPRWPLSATILLRR